MTPDTVMIKAPTNKRTSHGMVILRRNSETTTPRSISKNGTKPTRRETVMGLAQYQVVLPQGDEKQKEAGAAPPFALAFAFLGLFLNP